MLKRKSIGHFLIALALFLHAHVVHASENKVALVIGNANYQSVPALNNPINDASDIAAALERMGFEVSLQLDVGFDGFKDAAQEFSMRSQDADVSIVYFAGHGIEIDKANYLLPIDAEMLDDQDVDLEAFQLRSLLQEVSSKNGITLMLVDACRDNPFASRLRSEGATRSIGEGLVRVDPKSGVLPGGVLIGYAAKEGQYALDGEGRNSPYASALLSNLEIPGLEVSKLFREVRDAVFRETDGAQEPFTYGSLPSKDIYLAGLPTRLDQDRNNLTESEIPSEFFEDFARAQRLNNTYLWKRFLKQYASLSDNALVIDAKNQLDKLLADEAKAQEEEEKRLWLVPSAGLNESGPLQLNRDERRRIQESLSLLGLDTGGIDGNFGPKSQRAVLHAKLLFGLEPGSNIDASLLRHLPDPDAVGQLKASSARSYETADLPANLEPRLEKALLALEGKELLFDYFQGHLYIAVLVDKDRDWPTILKFAAAAGGHLATIESEEENRFVVDLFSQDKAFLWPSPNGYWLGPTFGLYQKIGSREPDGGWEWVTGEPLGYRNWRRGSPNNYAGRESHGRFLGSVKNDPNGKNVHQWDDDAGQLITGYLIEIE